MKKIPIISVSQQNRSSTESGLSTSHVAQTDRISQDSTLLLFLEQKDDVLTLNITKSRDSETNKKIRYAIDLDKGIFVYIPEENIGIRIEDDILITEDNVWATQKAISELFDCAINNVAYLRILFEHHLI